jgi:hypothetical protein
MSSRFHIQVGDCRDLLKRLRENTIDAICTDPPFHLTTAHHLTTAQRFGKGSPADARWIASHSDQFSRLAKGFCGYEWDGGNIAFDVDLWRECWRVLKPGAYAAVFGYPSTEHRMVCAIEDAGFRIREKIIAIFGSGFPKSKDVASALDKLAGYPNRGRAIPTASAYQNDSDIRLTSNPVPPYEAKTALAKRYEDHGTALKPSYLSIGLYRKPLVGTLGQNVEMWGTGGLNIGACRIPSADPVPINRTHGWTGFGELHRPAYTPMLNIKRALASRRDD